MKTIAINPTRTRHSGSKLMPVRFRKTKIAIPTSTGWDIVPIDDIVLVTSDSNYAYLHLGSGKKLLCAKTLKYFDGILRSHNFLRVHHQYLINPAYLIRIHKGKQMEVELSHGLIARVSRTNKAAFMQFIVNNF
jgi:two-component system LytT family response regulator